MKYLIPLLLLLVIFGCSRETKKADRLVYWENQFSKKLEVGASVDEIRNWSLLHNIPFEVVSIEDSHTLVLEVQKENSIVCVDWTYTLSFQLNEQKKLTAYDIGRAGRCL
jgi:hypothetical protein